ncbi:MAG: carboxyl transferase domain-containing protein [Alphaproteobacteria bacterium]|jgi:acetyl-CoA carboxylase carboxyltransferase component|nr:carboxyl transferase domain-containing protein [Alphaproteobacteria bacterium]MDP6832307.1 carboxyl transferase domain-containing protein [Alphaproteobacteria bacterium]
MAMEEQLRELAARRQTATAMGSARKLEEIRNAGHLNVRERIAYLFDEGSFLEQGLHALPSREEDHERAPGDGSVDGIGAIKGRLAVINAADFSAMGASSAEIAGLKMVHSRQTAIDNGIPLIMLCECSGGRIPDIMGARGIHKTGEYFDLSHDRQVPRAAAVLGQSYGGGTWRAVTSDFVVMRKGAVMAVSSANVTSVAISEDADPEELGGWRMQTGVTGQVDLAVDSDREALDAIKAFLGYLPPHNGEAPPERTPEAADAQDQAALFELVPESRAKVYDMRKVVRVIVDRDSYFPIKDRFARNISTGLARLNGRSVGVIAPNPMFKGGALDSDACDKAISFIALCDSYNLPLITLADTPGFLVGVAGEKLRLPGKIMNYMQALQMATVPKLSVIVRKSYGQAHLNMGAGVCDDMAAWVTADISFMDPNAAVNVVHRVREEDEPERYRELVKQVMQDSSAYDLAACYRAQTVLDPTETRDWLARMLEVHRRRPTGGIGKHRLATWPTTF